MTLLPTTRVDRRLPRVRRGAAAFAAIAVLGGLSACADSEGPERGATADDLQDIEDRISAVEDRVGVIEDDSLAPAPEDLDDVDHEVWSDPEGLLGEEVTVSAEVTEVLGSSGSDVALRIADEGREAIAVISTDAPAGLAEDDVVEVTGTVMLIEQDSFEDDFGVSPDTLLGDPEAFFTEAEDQVALSASELTVLDEDA